MSVNDQLLRSALGCYTTGVTVVTFFDARGRPRGFTASSFTSVSLDPPILLVCVNKQSRSLPDLQAAGAFAVNVLTADQSQEARRFASAANDRFGETSWEVGVSGAPKLTSCKAMLDCSLHHVFSAGDHQIIFGAILDVFVHPHSEPLVYSRGNFGRFVSPGDAAAEAARLGGNQ